MLARKRMIGAELSEDPDHHAPDQIAPIGVLLGGNRVLEELERLAVIAFVPGREPRAQVGVRRSGTVPVAALQARTGHEAIGEEVSGYALEQLERLIALAAREQDPAEGDRRLRMAGIDVERLAQRLLVASRGELVRRRGDERVQELLDARRWDRSGELSGELAVLERLHGRDAAHVEARGEALVGVDVDLREIDLAFTLSHRGFERRPELPAGAAPLGPEVDDHRDFPGALDHLGHEVGFGHVSDQTAIEVTERAESANEMSDAGFEAEGSLRGRLLIASPALADPNFARSVVLITEHGGEGAMGVVLNRPSETSVGDVAPELADVTDDLIYIGGPVQPQALVVLAEFSDPSAAAWIVAADVGFVAAETADLEQIVRRGRVYAGYSGWGEGQLEAELEEEAWIVEPPLPAELFPDDPESLWHDVLTRKGGQFALVARMPEDPSLN